MPSFCLGSTGKLLERLRPGYRRLMPFVVAGYALAFVLAFLLLNVRLSVEWVAIALIGAALLTGRIKTFVRDWGVFIVAVIAWQVTDGLATKFNFPWHVQEMITVDRWLFQPVLHGQLPVNWLQQHIYNPKILSWVDVLSVVMYSLHFLLPLAAGFVLWLVNREMFHKFATCFVIAAILGFATYIVFPAVPPWMAAQYAQHCVGNGNCYKLPGNPVPYVPWVYNVWAHVMSAWVNPNHGNAGFGPLSLGYDLVGAMPSEHIMYPTLVFLFMRRQFGKIGYLMIPYTGLVFFAVVYTGQHWVIDGIVGATYAVAVYLAVMKLFPVVAAYFARNPIPNPFSELVPGLGRALPKEMVAVENSERGG